MTWESKYLKCLASSGVKPAAFYGEDSARTLMIVPCPKDAREAKRPLAGAGASTFLEVLDEQGFSPYQFFIIFANPIMGDSGKGAGYMPTRKFMEEFFTKHGRLCICIGGEAFKFLFGNGKKPGDTSLAGQVIHAPCIKYNPVFYFPDYSIIAEPEPTGVRRADFRALDYYTSQRLKFIKWANKLKGVYDEIYT